MLTVSYYTDPVHGIRTTTHRTRALSSAITYSVWLDYVAYVAHLRTYASSFDGRPSTIKGFHLMHVLDVGGPLLHSFAFSIFLSDVSMASYCSGSLMSNVCCRVPQCMSFLLLLLNMFHVPDNMFVD